MCSSASWRTIQITRCRRCRKKEPLERSATQRRSPLQPVTSSISFTGPLYFIYKIITVINACKQLKTAYPDHTFVPVYWMASEDHDFDEIKYFRLYGKKYTWETDQQGAVGRFSTRDLAPLLKEVPGDATIFKDGLYKDTAAK